MSWPGEDDFENEEQANYASQLALRREELMQHISEQKIIEKENARRRIEDEDRKIKIKETWQALAIERGILLELAGDPYHSEEERRCIKILRDFGEI